MTVTLDVMTLPYGNLRSGTSPYGRSGECFIERTVTDLYVPDVHPKKRDYVSNMHWTVRGHPGERKGAILLDSDRHIEDDPLKR